MSGYPPAPQRKLTRSATDKWLGGVCGGIAEYAGWDPTLIRVVTLVLVIVGFGTVGVAYLVAWIVMPLPAPPAPPFQQPWSPPPADTTPTTTDDAQ